MKQTRTQETKIVLATGGSGGHLLPAQQLAMDLKRNAHVLFAGHGLNRSPFFQRSLFSFYEIESAPPSRHVFSFFRRLYVGVKQSLALLRSEQVDAVVGFGSFHSFPVLFAALLLRKPIFLFEANCTLGKVNRFFAPFAKQIGMQFALPSKKVVQTPLLPWDTLRPILDRDAVRSSLGFSAGVPLILVFGGSQGSSFLNRAVPSVLERDVQVIHLTGKEDSVADVANAYRAKGISALVKGYTTDMHTFYAVADAAICRAGASTIAELIHYNIPALLIPFPHASDDHQRSNAIFLEKKIGGASMLLEHDASQLSASIQTLLANRNKFREHLQLFSKSNPERISFAEQILNKLGAL